MVILQSAVKAYVSAPRGAHREAFLEIVGRRMITLMFGFRFLHQVLSYSDAFDEAAP